MACCMKSEHEEVKHVLTNLITQLCKNGVKYSDKLHIEGLVGVTVDHSDVFFVRISETIDKTPKSVSSTDSCAARSSPRNARPHTQPHRQPAFSPGSGRRTHTASPSPHRQSPLLASGVAQRTNPKSSPPVYRAAPLPTVRKPPEVKIKPEVVELDDDDDEGPEQEEESRPSPISPQLQKPQDILPTPVTVPCSESEEQEAPKTATSATEGSLELPTNVTVIAPSDSELDDTQAMRQGYPMQDQEMSQHEDFPPPAKRVCLDSPARKQNNPVYVGQWPLLAAESGNSSSSPATGFSNASIIMPDMSGNTRGFKNPRNNTMCQPVRDVLEHSLARPVLAEAHEVTAFRLFWRGQDTITGWKNIIYNRMELDAVVAEYPGVSFFISAITATARDPKTTYSNNDARLRAYPALGYWIVTRDASFDRHALMKKLSEAAEGAELKTMLQCDGEKVNEVGALNLIVKDYGKGYVQQRIKESAGEDHPTIRFILKEDHFEEKLLEAVDLLSGVGCPVSLEKVEVDNYDAENEETSETTEEPKSEPKETEPEETAAKKEAE